MASISNNMNVSSASLSAGALSQKVSKHGQNDSAENQAVTADISTAVNNGSVVDADKEVILDIESYKEELTEKLEALKTTLSDLDQGVAKKKDEALNVESYKEELTKSMEALRITLSDLDRGVAKKKDEALNVESYKEELTKSLEALRTALSDLDQAIANRSTRKIKKFQENPEDFATRKQEDPLLQFIKELLEELNGYGGQNLTDIQGDVSAERALALLKE